MIPEYFYSNLRLHTLTYTQADKHADRQTDTHTDRKSFRRQTNTEIKGCRTDTSESHSDKTANRQMFLLRRIYHATTLIGFHDP
jgi:hypothetical protein